MARHGITVTEIVPYDRSMYSVRFRRPTGQRGPRESSVEIDRSGRVRQRWDATNHEVGECMRALAAYVTLERMGFFRDSEW